MSRVNDFGLDVPLEQVVEADQAKDCHSKSREDHFILEEDVYCPKQVASFCTKMIAHRTLCSNWYHSYDC